MSTASDHPHTLPLALAVAAMVASAACWGGATVLTKAALEALPPFTLLALQLSASAACLWAATFAAGLRPGPLRPAARAAATGLLEPGLAYALGVPGLALTTAGNASVISALEPVFIVLAAWALLARRPDARTLLAIAAAVAGVCLVSLPDLAGPGAGPGAGHAGGDALVLLGTAFAALYVVMSSRLVTRTAPLLLTALQQTAGLALALLLATLVLGTGLERLPEHVPPATIALAATTGIVQYALPFWLYLVALRGMPVGMAGMFLTLSPVFGLLGAALFLGEIPGPAQIGGTAIILAAIVAILARQRG